MGHFTLDDLGVTIIGLILIVQTRRSDGVAPVLYRYR